MGDIAISAAGLGKRYTIGQRRDLTTLRESLAGIIRAPRPVSVSDRKNSSAFGRFSEGYVWAIRDVDFDVKFGELVGLMGHNGSGKTTVLKILARITQPTVGYAEVCGRVGTLLELGAGLHGELTGRENVHLNGAVKGMARIEVKRKFDEIVAFAELESFIDTPLKYYSSGMCIRLAFAVALHLDSEILLVDEVLAQADSTFQAKCLEKMANAAKEGNTVLFVSHDSEYIRQFCSRAIVFNRGQITCSAPAAEAVEYYRSISCNQPERFEFLQTAVDR